MANGSEGAPPAVLVIDDEKNQRGMLAFALTDHGYTVVAVESGAAALAAANLRPFDVAVCDIKMPGLDGVDTLKALKAQNPRLQVIMVTGYASPKTAMASMKLGAFNYLAKPYDIQDLIIILEKAVARGRQPPA